MGKESLIQAPEPPSAQQARESCSDVCNSLWGPCHRSGRGQWPVRCGVQGRGQKHVEEPVSCFSQNLWKVPVPTSLRVREEEAEAQRG